MTFSYSLSSSSRPSVSDRGRRHGKYGIPAVCFCSGAAILRTSHTSANPGRRFYSCERSEEGGSHIFKWWDEAIMEEMQDVKHELGDITDRIEYVHKDGIRRHTFCVDTAMYQTLRLELEKAVGELNELKARVNGCTSFGNENNCSTSFGSRGQVKKAFLVAFVGVVAIVMSFVVAMCKKNVKLKLQV